MAIHPPMLYLGYVGLTAPFAYALGSLVIGAPGTAWVTRTKRLTLLAWSFLTIGILLGGWWSYEVLGWGGYWAWDPVENASFLPWLTATAFIHSSTVQVRRGALESWNYLLVISTFALTILGTFLTRSGVITSVHSFTQSGISPALLAFFIVTIVVGLGLFATRAHRVAEGGAVGDPVSREGGMLINNILLSAWGATVLIGTVYPILVEAFATRTVGVGRGFFDATSIPLAFALLLVMGVGPITPWKRGAWRTIAARLAVPAQAALVIGALAALAGVRSRAVLVAIVLAAFTASTPVAELWRLGRARAAKGESFGTAAWGLIRRDRGYWGGMLSHLGIAVIAIGIAGSAGLAMDLREVTLPRNEPVQVMGYELEFRTGFAIEEPQRSVVGATIDLRRNDRPVDVLRPAINDYRVQAVPTPAVHSGIDEDVYVSLRAVDQNRALVDVQVFPLQWMVWMGGFLIAGGGFWSLTGKRRSRVEAST
jgi:cytochrome c-type biogenesis protein CcmF